MTIANVLSLILSLSFIKLVAFGFCLPKNIDYLMCSGNYSSFPVPIYLFLIIVLLFVLFYLIKI
jgi:hypothetical protein